MNTKFFIDPSSLVVLDETKLDGAADPTRRAFIKRAGGASVASLVAMAFTTQEAKADPISFKLDVVATDPSYSNPPLKSIT